MLTAWEADLHGNSTVGVNPVSVDRGDDGEWLASDWGRWLWDRRVEYWDWVWSLKKEYSAELWAFGNGDLLDDPYHPTTKVVTGDKALIVEIGVRNHQRPREMADYFFVTGGTSAHVGIDFWIEELLAERLDATQDEERGKYAWSHFLGEASGVLIDACHHAETYGWRPWTERAAAVRQSEIIRDRYVEMGSRVPDLAFRAHGHYVADSGIGKLPRTLYQFAWQLTNGTTFGQRKGTGYHFRPVGGMIALCRDGQYHVEFKSWQHEGKKVWKPT